MVHILMVSQAYEAVWLLWCNMKHHNLICFREATIQCFLVVRDTSYFPITLK